MKKEAVQHIIDSAYAYAYEGKRIVIRIKTAKNDIQRCTLFLGDRVYPNPIVKMSKVSMNKVAADELYDYFEVRFDAPYTRLCYYFLLDDGETQSYYYDGEFKTKIEEDRTLYYQFPYIRREEAAEVPQWAKTATMYQIFPDSFATEEGVVTGNPKEVLNAFGEVSRSRFGGTLKGIESNIGYLVDLGIDCLYLNPIFTASQWHKYDTIDYFSIDPCLGTLANFKSLVDACHEKGIRVLLDGVFNHCGWQFFAFKDVMEKGEDSRYKEWFYDLKFPIITDPLPNYECFAYVKEMPKLNTSNPEVIDYFCKVGKYWITEAGIDGWRLDVANEVDHDFWRTFRKAIKTVSKDAFLVAEIWEDAENWLNGDQFDSAMNYKFSHVCTEFFAKKTIGIADFDYSINKMLMRYKHPMTYVQMNLLDSHDVTRFLSRAGGDLPSFKLAVLYQMMFVGIPSIYYGDEKGIMGIEEEEYRKPMIWDNEENRKELVEYYKKLIRIRKQYQYEMTSAYKTMAINEEEQVYSFRRGDEKKYLMITLNRSDEPRTIKIKSEKAKLYDLLSDREYICQDGESRIVIEPMEGVILL